MSWNIGLQDKIGTVSHSVGVISLQSSLLTLGGRQYQTGILSRTISADVTLAANTLYFVYAQVVSGVVALRVSVSAPSVYRVANPTAKIVGAFYANMTPSFGVFVNIDGIPSTELWQSGVLSISATGSNPTKGGGLFVDRVQTRRHGNRIFQEYEYRQTTVGAAGSGNYLINIPGFAADLSLISGNSDGFSGAGGSWRPFSVLGYGGISDSSTGTSSGWAQCQMYSVNTQFRVWMNVTNTGGAAQVGGWGANFFPLSNSFVNFGLKIDFPAVGLTNTPLKDL